MSKAQHGNREAKKPKKVQQEPKPLPAEAVPAAPTAADRLKKKR